MHIVNLVIRNRVLTKLRAYPFSLMFESIFNAILSVMLPLFIYHYIYKDSVSSSFVEYTKTTDYLSYLILGQMTGTFVFSSIMSAGQAILYDIHEGVFNHFLISPSRSILFFIGSYLETLIHSCIQAGIIFFVGILFGMNFMSILIQEIIILVILFLVSSFSLSIFLSAFIIYFKDTYLTESTLSLSIALLCGIAFPIEYLPTPLRYISNAIPLTHLLKLFRKFVIEGDLWMNNFTIIFSTLIISLIYLLVGYLWYKKKIERTLVEKILA